MSLNLRGWKSDLIGLAVVGLAVQAVWLLWQNQPNSMDAYYYSLNGRQLATGAGFVEPVIWQFLDDPPGLPAPSHTYWMPLASILAALGYQLGDGFWAAQLPFWLLTGLLPLLGYVISRQLTGARWAALTAGLFTAAGGFYAPFWVQPETFAPFAWAGGLSLLFLGMIGPGQRRGTGLWLAAGLAAGLAHLARADGILILIVALALWAGGLANWSDDGRRRPLLALSLLLLGYGLIMGGWFMRNELVLGRPLSLAGGQTIFLTHYDDLFAYGRSFDLASFWAWGAGNILRSRVQGLWLALQTFIAVSGLIFLTPFVLVGWIGSHREQPRLMWPVTAYALLLFFTMSLIFTYPGSRGGLFHSSIALWPWMMAFAADGLDRTINWLAERRPARRPERDRRIYPAMFVLVALGLSFSLGLTRVPEETTAARYQEMADQLPAGSVVMVGNPPAFAYHTGLPAVSVPNEPAAVLLQAAARYDVRYLILDENHPKPLADLYAGRESWPDIQLIAQYEGANLYALSQSRP